MADEQALANEIDELLAPTEGDAPAAPSLAGEIDSLLEPPSSQTKQPMTGLMDVEFSPETQGLMRGMRLEEAAFEVATHPNEQFAHHLRNSLVEHERYTPEQVDRFVPIFQKAKKVIGLGSINDNELHQLARDTAPDDRGLMLRAIARMSEQRATEENRGVGKGLARGIGAGTQSISRGLLWLTGSSPLSKMSADQREFYWNMVGTIESRDPKSVWARTGEMGTQMAPGLALGGAPGLLGASGWVARLSQVLGMGAAMAPQIYEPTLAQAESLGLTGNKAKAAAGVATLAESIIEGLAFFPGSKAMRTPLGRSTGKMLLDWATAYTVGSSLETVEEFYQGMSTEAILRTSTHLDENAPNQGFGEIVGAAMKAATEQMMAAVAPVFMLGGIPASAGLGRIAVDRFVQQEFEAAIGLAENPQPSRKEVAEATGLKPEETGSAKDRAEFAEKVRKEVEEIELILASAGKVREEIKNQAPVEPEPVAPKPEPVVETPDYSTMTLAELKDTARGLGLKVGGTKEIVRKRIEAHKAEEAARPQLKEFSALQRVEESGKAPDLNKPQGLYLTPDNVRSPHKEAGGKKFTFLATPKRVLDVSGAKKSPIRRGAKDSGAGVKAIRALDEQEFQRLSNLSKDELIKEVGKLLPEKDATRYYDKQELLEVIGAEMARRKGYDAIIDRDAASPEFSEFVALTPEAVRPSEAVEAAQAPTAEASDELDSLSKREVQKVAQAEGVSMFGTKSDVIDRIRENRGGKQAAEPEKVQARVAPPGGIGIDAPTQGTRKGRISDQEIIESMSKLFDVPIRKGRVRHPKAAGIFNERAEEVRMKKEFGGDLGVATHEVAHKIDKQYKPYGGVPESMLNELGALDYDPKQSRPGEGFAEYMRYLLTNDPLVASEAPLFHDYFMNQWLPQNEAIANKLQRTQQMIKQYQQQGSKGRVAAAISKTGKPARPVGVPRTSWWRDLLRRAIIEFYAAAKDDVIYATLFMRDAQRRGWKGEPGDKADQVIRAFSQAGPTFAMTAVEEGPSTVTGNMQKLGPGLREGLTPIRPNEYDTWIEWAYTRHAAEVYEKNREDAATAKRAGKKAPKPINPGISEQDAKYVYEQNKNNARFIMAADALTTFNNNMLVMLADAGVISPTAAATMMHRWNTYLPLHRVVGRLSGTPKGVGRTLATKGSPIKGRRGSALQIIDPVHATIERAVRFYTRALQQQALKALRDTAMSTEGMGGWMVRVPPGTKATTTDTGEIKKALEKMGVHEDVLNEIPDDELINLYRPNWNANPNEPVVLYQDGDNKELWHVDPALFRTITGMNHYALPFLLDITFGKGARMVKLGATSLNPEFMARNVARDQITRLIQTTEARGIRGIYKSSPIPLPGTVLGSYIYHKAMKAAGKTGDPMVQLWEEMGGELAAILGLDIKLIKKRQKQLMRRGAGKAIAHVAESPIETLRGIVNMSEVGPRITEFEGVLRRHGWGREKIKAEGIPPRHVLVEAINAANEVTVNFKRMGYWGRPVNAVIPFFNAALEGGDKFIRTWKDHPVRTAMYSATLAAGTVAYWMQKKDNDAYKEEPDWLKYGFWTINDDAGRPVLRIPRPFEWGWIISAGTEAMLNRLYGRDPEAVMDWAKAAGKAMVPGGQLSLVTPMMETAFNYDFFREAPIVSESKQRLLPKDQYTEYNTLTMRAIMDWLNDRLPEERQLSPAKMEHLIDGLTGSMYSHIAKPLERMLAGAEGTGTLVDVPVAGAFGIKKDYSKSTDEFYEGRDMAIKRWNSLKLGGTFDAEARAEYKRYGDYAGLISQVRRLMPSTANRERRFKYDKYIIGLARAALNKEPLQRYPNPLTAHEETLPPEIFEVVNDYLDMLERRMDDWSLPKGDEPIEFRRKTFKADIANAQDEYHAIMQARKKSPDSP